MSILKNLFAAVGAVTLGAVAVGGVVWGHDGHDRR